MTEGAVSNSNCNVLRLGKAKIKASDLVPVQYVQGGAVASWLVHLTPD